MKDTWRNFIGTIKEESVFNEPASAEDIENIDYKFNIGD